MNPNQKTRLEDKSKVLYNQITHYFLKNHLSKIKPSGFAVFNALIYFAHKKKKDTWVSYTEICKLSGVGKTTIWKAIKKLEERKIIAVYREKGNTNLIQILTK